MNGMDTNVILKYKRLCDCWLCSVCGCENPVTDAKCTVCGAERTKDSEVRRVGEEEIAGMEVDSYRDRGDSTRMGDDSTYVDESGIDRRDGLSYDGFRTDDSDFTYEDSDDGSGNIGLVVAIVFIVIAVIAVSIGILLYQ